MRSFNNCLFSVHLTPKFWTTIIQHFSNVKDDAKAFIMTALHTSNSHNATYIVCIRTSVRYRYRTFIRGREYFRTIPNFAFGNSTIVYNCTVLYGIRVPVRHVNNRGSRHTSYKLYRTVPYHNLLWCNVVELYRVPSYRRGVQLFMCNRTFAFLCQIFVRLQLKWTFKLDHGTVPYRYH